MKNLSSTEIQDIDSYKKSPKHRVYFRSRVNLLTTRQLECLALIAIGKTLKEISNIFQVSQKTVDDHVKRLKMKLKCYSKSELSLAGAENNLNQIALSILSRSK